MGRRRGVGQVKVVASEGFRSGEGCWGFGRDVGGDVGVLWGFVCREAVALNRALDGLMVVKAVAPAKVAAAALGMAAI